MFATMFQLNSGRKMLSLVALHLDLGWGEQFVSSITAVVERAALSKRESSG